MDAHLFGKATLPLYRSLFSFTGAMLILVGEESKPTANLFSDGIFNFLNNGVNPRTDYNPSLHGELDENRKLPWDFLGLPHLIFDNLNSYPKLFKMMMPEAYQGADHDLHMQLATAVSVILNRRMGNPHMRIEFVNFLLHLVP